MKLLDFLTFCFPYYSEFKINIIKSPLVRINSDHQTYTLGVKT
nr:MAG TPA: hypothetical protein [Bacteriophage sp.]